MANEVKWGANSLAQTMLSTEMNGLGNNTLSALGTTEFDNATSRYMFADAELALGSITPSAGGFIAVYLAAALDGSNYPDVKREYGQQLLFTIGLDSGASAKRSNARGIQLPPFKFKLYIDNQSGVSLNAANNVLKMWFYNPEVQ